MKYCWKCKNTLPIDNFYNCKSRKDGKQSICKDCDRLHNKNANVVYNKASSHLKLTYGITLKEKEFLFEKQNRCCGLCEDKIPSLSLACIDHNHKTGKIRKLLCNSCNLYLGFYEKRPNVFNKFEQYLKDND